MVIEKRMLIQAIDDYSGEDPLQPWLKYVKWTKENFPSVKQELFPVLESCTKSFKDDLRYKDDVRYLRVWIQYADCSQDPMDIFKFLEVNGIGQGHALFYEAYATSLEFRRNFSKANLVYENGIARGAEPIVRLSNMYKDFKERMVKRIQRQMQEEMDRGLGGNPRQSSSAFHAVDRGNIPVLSQGQHSNRDLQQRHHQQGSIKQSNEGQIPRASRKEQAFSVFADEEQPRDTVDPFKPSVGPWPSLGTQAERTKENRQVPTKWTNVKIPQKKIPGQKAPAELEVYVDEEFAGTSTAKIEARHEELPVRLRLDGSTNLTRATESALQLPPIDPTAVQTGSKPVGNETKENVKFLTTVQVDIAGQHSISIIFPSGNRHASGCNPTRNGIEASFEEIRLFSMVSDDLEYWAQLESHAIPCQEDAKTVDQIRSDILVKQNQESVALDSRPIAVGAPCSLLTKISDVSYESEKKRHQTPGLKVAEDLPEANRMVSGQSKSELASVIPFGNSSGTIKPVSMAAQDNADNTCVCDGEETTALRKVGAGPIFSHGNNDDSLDSPFGLNTKEDRHNSLVDPTIHTIEARADIVSMFNMPFASPFADSKSRKNKRSEDASGRESKRTKATFEVFCDNEGEQETDGQMRAELPSNGFELQRGGTQILQTEVGATRIHITEQGKENKRSEAANARESKWTKAAFEVFCDDEGEQETNGQMRAELPNNGFELQRGEVRQGTQILQTEVGATGIHMTDQGKENKRSEGASAKESKRTKAVFEVFCDDDGEQDTNGQMRAELPINGFELQRGEVRGGTQILQTETGVTEVHITDEGKDNLTQNGSFDSDEENRPPLGRLKECKQNKIGCPVPQQSAVEPLNELCLEKLEVPASGGDEEAMNHANERLRMSINNWKDAFAVWEDEPPQEVASGTSATLANSESETNHLDLFPGGEQCCVDPWKPAIVEGVLAKLTPPLHHYKGYFDYRPERLSANFPSDFTKKNSGAPIYIHLGETGYMVKSCLGEGAFARIYQAFICNENITDTTCFNANLALKVQKPACPWEFFIYRQLDARIPGFERASFGRALDFYLYAGSSVLVCDAKEHGTLQDVINAHLGSRLNMSEVLCVFYTIELLRILETLHSAHIIHGDFKPDNLLIRMDPGPISNPWSPARPNNWIDKGLCLIDWGRSIDLARFPKGTTLKGDCKTEAFRCTEMTEGKPWTFQTDTFGLCGIVHCMLHGSYMEVEKVTEPSGNHVYKPRIPFKRYMKKELWQKLFNTLLNIKGCENNPPLGPLRREFEEHLKHTEKTANTLKLALIKQNSLMTEYMRTKRKTMR